jgi:SEC-C motif
MSSRVKVSRNNPCPCGSGRKYKRCCYAKAAPLVQGPDGELAHELPIGPEVGEILQRQREKFIARYGREPGADDPIFVDVPSDDEYDAMVTKAMEQAGVAPQVIYAFRKRSCPVKRWKFDQRHLHRVNVQFDPESTLDEKPACVHA